MILEKEVQVKVNNRQVKYYRDKGYEVKGGQEILIKIEDLPTQSHLKVKIFCDFCQKELLVSYYNYNISIKNTGSYYCKDCKHLKAETTNLQKYGVKSTLQTEKVKEKSKETLIEKYGVDHFSKSSDFKEKLKNKLGSYSSLTLEAVKEKSKETLLKKYGVDHFSKSLAFRQKYKETMLKKYGVDHFSKTEVFKKKLKEKFIREHGDFQILDIDSEFLIIKCDKCEKVYQIHKGLFKNRVNKYKVEPCVYCNPINSFTSSGAELKFKEFIQENYEGEIITNSKQIITPYELDIYLPELKLAFEFNGLWWHNELYKEKKYHLQKTEACEEQGLHLIHIYEDDWLYKRDIIESRILNLLGQSQRIYARKCELKEIYDNKVIRNFLENNHIQGFVGSKVKLGLFYEDKLVSLMTLGKKRKAMNSSSQEGEYELLRFCNQKGLNVVGGASKLFKYFIRNYQPMEVISYADRSWSQGHLYEKLGFKYISKTPVNYYYVIDGVRKHRFNYRKDKLVKEGFDPSKNEHEIMLERGLYRIYDSGSLKYVHLN
jgi:hypothetical protein